MAGGVGGTGGGTRLIICANAVDVLTKLEEKSIDLILTDPPYGVNLSYDQYDDTEDNWYQLISEVLPQMIRVAKMVIMPSCQIKRLKWFYTNFPPDWLICWYKGSTGCAAYIGFNDWEPHLVYGRTKNRLYMHDYFKCQNNEKLGNYGHPCPKPIGWATWIMERATEKGNTIMDPFMGSGTVGVAAKLLQRDFLGIDISPAYCDIAKHRIASHPQSPPTSSHPERTALE